MRYVLGDSGARFLREQMAAARAYRPAQPLPSREVRRDFAAPVVSSLAPLTVRFVPSPESGAGPGEGDYVIYVPPGSVTVNGVAIGANDVAMPVYDAGEYAARPNWYLLPPAADGDSVVMDVSYSATVDTKSVVVYFYCGLPTDVSQDEGTVERQIVIADVSVDEESSAVGIEQVTKGPVVLELGVEMLNGAMGRLDVVGGEDGMTVRDGQKYWINVVRDEGSSAIEVTLSDVPPNGGGSESDDDGYCNSITEDDIGNGISGGDAGGLISGGGGGNDISYWPCDRGGDDL